jgi:exodeoxyribonuclease III
MAFRKKADFILTYKPDILIVPECEHPDKLLFPLKHQNQQTFYGLVKIKTKDLQYFHTVIFGLQFLTTTTKTYK